MKCQVFAFFWTQELSLSHGNTDVEQGFSTSALNLIDNKASISEETLNSHMIVKCALKNNFPHTVSIIKKFLTQLE